MKNKICSYCKIVIKRPAWAVGKKWDDMKFCSLSCSRKSAINNNPPKHLKEYSFKKGQEPWNKGKKFSAEYIKKTYAGENNPNWKGDNAKYKAIHKYINSRFPKTGVCARCKNKTGTDYANISGTYDREPESYMELCYSCHMKLDRGSLMIDIWIS